MKGILRRLTRIHGQSPSLLWDAKTLFILYLLRIVGPMVLPWGILNALKNLTKR